MCFCLQKVRLCINSLIPATDRPLCFCLQLQGVRFCINRVSILSLIVPCAFLLIDGAFLHQQRLVPVTDCPLCVSAYRKYVYVSTVSFLPLIVPCVFLLTGSAFLHQQSLNPVADYPLLIPAHQKDGLFLHQQSLITVTDYPLCLLLIACVYLLLCCIVPVAHNMPFYSSL